MTRLDDLTDLLESRGDAADGLHPNLGDVRSRARRQRHSTALVGAVASIAVIGGLAAAVVADTGDDGSGQRVGTSDTADQPTASPVLGPIPDYERTLPDGHAIRIRPYGSHTYFGPFGDTRTWTAPADCAPGISVDLALPGIGAVGSRGGSSGVYETERSVATQMTWSSDAPGSGTQAVVALLPDAEPGATYRLLVDGSPVDSATATSTAVALAAPGAAGEQRLNWTDPVDARLQQLAEDGTVVADDPLPLAEQFMPPACASPPEPSGLAPATPDGSQDPDDVAIRAIVASLMTPGGNMSAAYPHVDDPEGDLVPLAGTRVPNNMATVAREIHRDSPTHAWVKYGFQLGGADVTAQTPDVLVGWVELNQRDGQWLLTKESYCAFSAGPIGNPCPGTESYTPVAASGVPGIYVNGD